MTPTFILAGYADSVGRGVGFLIPVFARTRSNALFVQRVSNEGVVLGFEEVGETAAAITYATGPVRNLSAGEEALVAFTFGAADIIVDHLEPFRAQLLHRIEDPLLTQNPFLAMEVADFLDSKWLKDQFAERALKKIAERSSKAAHEWLDLSILTPEFRSGLLSELQLTEASLRHVVAITSEETVQILGLPEEVSSHQELVSRVATDALARLKKFYVHPRAGWTVRTGQTRRARKFTHPDALVWLVDRSLKNAQPSIEGDSEWRIDTYAPELFEEFLGAVGHAELPAFAVVRRDQYISAEELDRNLPPTVTTIEIGASRSNMPDRGGERPSGRQRTRILVPPSGFHGAPGSPTALGAMVRQLVAISLEGNLRSRPKLGADWIFVKARGTGPSPQADALGAIYDRLMGMDLSMRDAIVVRSPKPRGEAHVDLNSLFEEPWVIHDPRVEHEASKSAADYSVLVPASDRARRDFDHHARAVRLVLTRNGWGVSEVRDSSETASLDIYGAGRPVRVVTDLDSDYARPRWHLSDLLKIDLNNVDTMAVTCDANAGHILSRLNAQGSLAANMRDIVSASPEGGIWSVLGSQLRRQSGGMASRARTHFMALILNHAFDRGDVNLPRPGELHAALHNVNLGSELHFSWGRVRQTSRETRASVRLTRNSSPNTIGNVEILRNFQLRVSPAAVKVLSDAVSSDEG